MSFFRIGIGRGGSIGIGPVTFYGGGRRSSKCARCGNRTSNKICASCRRDVKRIMQETVPVFIKTLSDSVNSKSVEERKKSLNLCYKKLKVLEKCDSYGVSWTELPNARQDFSYATSLKNIHSKYSRLIQKTGTEKLDSQEKVEKLSRKYSRLAKRLKNVRAVDFHSLFQNSSAQPTRSEAAKQSSHANSASLLDEYAEILKESLPLARAKHLKKETRLDAYDVCLDITRNMLKVATGETAMKVLDLHDVIKVEYDELKTTSS